MVLYRLASIWLGYAGLVTFFIASLNLLPLWYSFEYQPDTSRGGVRRVNQCSDCIFSMTNRLYDFHHCCVCGRWAKMRWCQCAETAYWNKGCHVSGVPAHKRHCSFHQAKIIMAKTIIVSGVLPNIMAFSRSLNIGETFR